MKWISRIWGGPFRTPPLQHPITVGWVLLKLLETVWRLFLIVIFVALLTGGWVWLSQTDPLETQIKVEVAQVSPDCKDPEYPVSVVITNESNKTVGEIDLVFRLYESGQSVDVATYPSKRSELHDILKPDHWLRYCYRMPTAESGTTGPYIVTADVNYAAEVSKDVPIAVAPPPIVRTNVNDETPPKKRTGWTKVGDYIGAIVLLASFAAGGFGLLLLADRILATNFSRSLNLAEGEDRQGCGILLAIGLANVLIVTAASYALSYAGLDGWINQVDRWSRLNGFADGGTMLLTGLACQWPWLVLLALPKGPFSSQS